MSSFYYQFFKLREVVPLCEEKWLHVLGQISLQVIILLLFIFNDVLDQRCCPWLMSSNVSCDTVAIRLILIVSPCLRKHHLIYKVNNRPLIIYIDKTTPFTYEVLKLQQNLKLIEPNFR